MNILFINIFVGFMVSEIPRVSVFGYFPLFPHVQISNFPCHTTYTLIYIVYMTPLRNEII